MGPKNGTRNLVYDQLENYMCKSLGKGNLNAQIKNIEKNNIGLPKNWRSKKIEEIPSFERPRISACTSQGQENLNLLLLLLLITHCSTKQPVENTATHAPPRA